MSFAFDTSSYGLCLLLPSNPVKVHTFLKVHTLRGPREYRRYKVEVPDNCFLLSELKEFCSLAILDTCWTVKLQVVLCVCAVTFFH